MKTTAKTPTPTKPLVMDVAFAIEDISTIENSTRNHQATITMKGGAKFHVAQSLTQIRETIALGLRG